MCLDAQQWFYQMPEHRQENKKIHRAQRRPAHLHRGFGKAPRKVCNTLRRVLYGKVHSHSQTPTAQNRISFLSAVNLPPVARGRIRTSPDALTIQQVITTTGYTDNTINRWLRQEHLKSVQTQTTRIIPKLWLIDFYCSYAYTISQMSDKHIKLMQKFFKQTGGK